MKFSEMKSASTGLPPGFEGQTAKWNEIDDPFVIEKVAVMQRQATDDDGNPLIFTTGPKTGQPIMDRTAVLQIRQIGAEGHTPKVIRTNSRRITALFTPQLKPEADGVTAFGDSYFFVEPPEEALKFVGFEQTYANGKKGLIADLELA